MSERGEHRSALRPLDENENFELAIFFFLHSRAVVGCLFLVYPRQKAELAKLFFRCRLKGCDEPTDLVCVDTSNKFIVNVTIPELMDVRAAGWLADASEKHNFV